MEDQTRGSRAKRVPYTRPVIEDLGSLQELTAAGGPTFGVDSSYNGTIGTFGVS
jgi:hypothetical protein